MGDAYKSNLCPRLLLQRISVPSVHINTFLINTHSSPVFVTAEACGSIWMTMWSVRTVGIWPQKTHNLSMRIPSTKIGLKFGHRKIRHIYFATKAILMTICKLWLRSVAGFHGTSECIAFSSKTMLRSTLPGEHWHTCKHVPVKMWWTWAHGLHGLRTCTLATFSFVEHRNQKFIIRSFTHMPIWVRTSTHELQSFIGGNSNLYQWPAWGVVRCVWMCENISSSISYRRRVKASF